MRGSSGVGSTVRRVVAKVQSRRALPVIVAAVIVLLIFYFATKHDSSGEHLGGSVGKVTREPEKETEKPVKRIHDPEESHNENEKPKEEARKPVEPDLPPVVKPDLRPPPVKPQAEKSVGEFEFKTGILPDKEKQDAVRAELKYSWDSYKKYAWGQG
jgi:type IV secretory pathway VirB10-like protein